MDAKNSTVGVQRSRPQPFHTSDKAKAHRGAVTGSRPHHYPEPGLELRVPLSPGTSLTALLGRDGGGGGAHALFPFLLD